MPPYGIERLVQRHGVAHHGLVLFAPQNAFANLDAVQSSTLGLRAQIGSLCDDKEGDP